MEAISGVHLSNSLTKKGLSLIILFSESRGLPDIRGDVREVHTGVVDT